MPSWAIGRSESDLSTATTKGALSTQAIFVKAQTLAILGRKDEALQLVIDCLDHGLSTVDVDLALDLNEVREDPRYRNRLAQTGRK